MANVFARRKPFRLTPPLVPEHAAQKQVCDVLRLELAPPGKVSAAGVVWFAIDHANYAGEVPGIRIGRGIVAGLADLFFLYRGQAFLIELKTPAGALSEAQQSIAAAVLSAAARYGVARTAAEVLALLDSWAIPRRRRLRDQGT